MMIDTVAGCDTAEDGEPPLAGAALPVPASSKPTAR